MKIATPTIDFSQPSRQSPTVVLLFIVKFLNVTIRKGWPGLVSMYIAIRQFDLPEWAIYGAASLFGLLYLLFCYLSYHRYKFHVKNGEIVIQEGVIYRSTLNLPFDRVQTINFKQNILHQLFGVVAVEIDSAGSKGSEISIDALTKEKANKFREFIIEQKSEAPNTAISEFPSTDEDLQLKPPTEKNKILLALNPIDLFKIGISQNHIRSMAIFFAFLWNIMAQLKDQFDIDEEESMREVTGVVGNDWLGGLGLAVIAVLIFSLFASLVITFLRNFDLRMFDTGNGLKKRYGLFEKHEQSTTIGKIQSISWGDNLIKKLFGLFAFRMFPSTSGTGQKKSAIKVIGCYQQHVDVFIKKIFGNLSLVDFTHHRMDSVYIIRTTLFFGILPAIALAAFGYLQYGLLSLFALIWVPIVAFAAYVYHRKWQLFLSDEFIKIDYGLFSHQHRMLAIYKIQAIEMVQSPFQRRKGLATINLYTAGKNFTLNYLDSAIANQLYNYILYKIEKSNKTWM